MADRFELGREIAADGRFQRQESAFRGWVTKDGSSGFPAAAGRYHLYVALACPWSHRTVIARRLKGLEETIGISYADPFRDARGWAFSGGEFTDRVNGWTFLSEAYAAADPAFSGRVTVPVLWDVHTGTIVSNESSDIMRMFNDGFGALARSSVDLYPAALREEIDAVDAFVYENVNDAVYRAGFATTQEAYDEAYEQLFDALDQLEARLAASRYLDRRLAHGGRLAAVPHARCASTPSTTRTSSATAAGSSTTRTCGAIRATCTSTRASPRRWRWTRSSATTSRPTTS